MKLRIIKTIFVSLVFSLLACTIPAHSIDNNPSDIVEMYSDEIPEIQTVFSGQVPEGCYQEFSAELKWHTQEQTLRYLNEVFNQKKFKELILDSDVWDNNIIRNNLLFVSSEGRSIFLDFHYEADYLVPILQSLKIRIHDSVFKQDKWNYPKQVSYWEGIIDTVSEMSWKYIDVILHYESNLMYESIYFPEKFTEKELFKNIKEKGLKESLIRAILIFDNNNQYSWNIAYNTEQERECGEQFLLDIKKYF